jgi:hypothetical protein
MAKSTLYKISDHWYHYKDGMFVFGYENKEDLEKAEEQNREIRGLEDLSMIENDADAPPVGPAARRGDVALARHGNPHEIGTLPAVETAHESFDIPESRRDFDKKSINFPSEFTEKRHIHAIARVAGIKTAPPEDAFFLSRFFHAQILPNSVRHG